MSRAYSYGTKTELDGLLFLDMTKLKSFKMLEGRVTQSIIWTNRVSGARDRIMMTVDLYSYKARIWYTATDGYTQEKIDYDYSIGLAASPCNYGGKRWWFICPLIRDGVKCNNRVRKLYMNRSNFGCRICQQLSYSSQNENKRFGRSVLFKSFDYVIKADELLSTIHVPYYKGRPTRKMRRYLKIARLVSISTSEAASIDSFIRKGVK